MKQLDLTKARDAQIMEAHSYYRRDAMLTSQAEKITRSCLRCDKTFEAETRFHRLCTTCRKLSE